MLHNSGTKNNSPYWHYLLTLVLLNITWWQHGANDKISTSIGVLGLYIAKVIPHRFERAMLHSGIQTLSCSRRIEWVYFRENPMRIHLALQWIVQRLVQNPLLCVKVPIYDSHLNLVQCTMQLQIAQPVWAGVKIVNFQAGQEKSRKDMVGLAQTC